MRIQPRWNLTFIILFIILILSNCQIFNNDTAVVWTSRPEIAAYVETFNSVQGKYRIELKFKPYPAEALLQEKTHPDVVFGERLSSIKVLSVLQSLDHLFKEEQIKREFFYPGLLKQGESEENQILLPVSFNLPVIMFEKGALENEGNEYMFMLSLDEIKELSRSFNQENDNGFVKLGFSPRWEEEFLYFATVLLGAEYRETSQVLFAWNDQKLREAIDFINKWVESVNGNIQKETVFNEKYLHAPGYKLINDGKILFYFNDVRSYFSIPEGKRDSLDFRWIASEGKIIASEEIFYAGIPKRAGNKKAAYAFLSWFFSPLTQGELLQTARLKRMRSFGIAGGLSSLPIINERELPRYYPSLTGHIPPMEFLTFPERLPYNWADLKEEVILPWILRETSANPSGSGLNESINSWLMQQPLR